MRWRIHDEDEEFSDWRPWYAWHPVKTIDGWWVWFEWVERQFWSSWAGCGYDHRIPEPKHEE